MPSAFLAHSSEDKLIVERIANDLEAISVNVWFDKWALRVGDSLLEKIAEGISSNDFLVVFLSSFSVSSKWVQLELNAGLMRELEENRVVVLPVLLSDCDVPALLKAKKWADFRPGYERGLDDLLCAVFPDADAATTKSKHFRTGLHLIAGLSQTDQRGSGTLNEVQISRIYDFREQFPKVLGREEQRLLFWSAVAFREANPRTPWFMCSTVPVWGLTAEASAEQKAAWITEGLSGRLFQYLVPFAEWAYHTAGPFQVETFPRDLVSAIELEGASPWTGEGKSRRALKHYLKLLAMHHREIFDEIFVPGLNQSKPNAHAILEATAHLDPPLPSEFYFKYLDAQEDVFLAGLRALVHLRSTNSLSYLRRALDREKPPSAQTLDAAFWEVGIEPYADELEQWLHDEPRREIRARLLSAAVNAGRAAPEIAEQTLAELRDEPGRTELLPSVVRAYMRSLNVLTDRARGFLEDRNPIIVEAAVFGIGRLAGPSTVQELLGPLLKARYCDVLAAAIECGARVASGSFLEQIHAFRRHEHPLVRAAFYRAMRVIQNARWEDLLAGLIEEAHPLVRLCGARVLATKADTATLDEWTHSLEVPIELKVAADESLFALPPFRPKWLEDASFFSSDHARLPVRLTSMDPDRLFLDTGLDTSRRIHIWVHEEKP